MQSTAPSIGSRLRDAREGRELSIEETAWRTRIRPDLLRALESDGFDSIGHHGSVRRHLQSYARFLGVDPGSVLLDFDERYAQEPTALEELDRQDRVAKRPPRAKWLIAAAFSAVLLLAGAIAGVLGGAVESSGTDPAPISAGSPRLEAQAASRSRAIPAAEVRTRLSVEALATTEVTVWIDGLQRFAGTLRKGSVRTFPARETVEILAGNGGTIRLRLNGERVPTGAAGAAFRARFGPHGPIAG